MLHRTMPLPACRISGRRRRACLPQQPSLIPAAIFHAIAAYPA
jgi:hypothetical protein